MGIARINEEFTSEAEFKLNYTKQDSVVLNLQRLCEASIDIANIIIKNNQLGIPQSARNSFELLHQGQIISQDITLKMQKMVGLRNIAVHDYQALNIDIVIAVVKHHLDDFKDFSQQILTSQTLS
ncbi:type VII toxin-antitoxin system HepT family RNase toxin [Motilimonas sp. KMU-193]|uniref:type VII toxin-antitoxin system HepT family RNase toxin n=1 Tax=Motilimonas sp. KMU-193 TaxID=3388668 RepID=UPI00396B0FD7